MTTICTVGQRHHLPTMATTRTVLTTMTLWLLMFPASLRTHSQALTGKPITYARSGQDMTALTPHQINRARRHRTGGGSDHGA